MKSKPAELSAGLVAIKGMAAPSPDMSGRAGASPSPASAVLPAEPAASNISKAASRNSAAEPESKKANFTPLNFRISASFRREFRTYAATHDLKLNELLRLCFEAYRRQQGD